LKKQKSLPEAGVVFVKDENGRYFLAEKVIGRDENEEKIGEGRLNGLGGGRNLKETQKEAIIREALEEYGFILHKKSIHLKAIVFCCNEKNDGSVFICKLYVFVATKWKGIISASDEMINGEWFLKEDVPYDQMIVTDKDWLPFVFDGESLYAWVFLRNSQREKTRETQIKFVKNLSCT